MEVADRIGFELTLVGPVAFVLWQARDAVPLQAAVQLSARQVWDRRLSCAPTRILNHPPLTRLTEEQARRLLGSIGSKKTKMRNGTADPGIAT